ncbi:lytic transglycosylase domain-containing protein [Sphingobium phenoxybenzoativorans]|uniref:lytic transglycosylase domain-containing protein n=1 Tax=Sphingobium phenoxybenzoativorans TaxID=1592790 RepID=UPI0009F22BBF|nr:lytic transglycosylase domain-containing protein [Sphingobium phenoxybenzoativorans]
MIIAGASAMLAAASPGTADSITRWQSHIAEASQRFGIPEHWIRHVMAVQSAGQTMQNGRPIRSRAGAMGLMQLMPDTWKVLHDALNLGSDPDDPRDNILAGTAYLREMYDSFGYPGLFAAYNAGPGRYGDFLAGKRALPRETSLYLRSITDRIDGATETEKDQAPTLFIATGEDKPGGERGIFVVKRTLP